MEVLCTAKMNFIKKEAEKIINTLDELLKFIKNKG